MFTIQIIWSNLGVWHEMLKWWYVPQSHCFWVDMLIKRKYKVCKASITIDGMLYLLVVSTDLKNSIQSNSNWSISPVGGELKYIWNHHRVYEQFSDSWGQVTLWLYLLGSTNISVDCCVPSWDPETSAWIQQLNQDQPSGSMLHLLYFAHFQLFSKRFMKFWNSNLQDLDNTSTTKSLLDKNRSHPPQQKSLHRRTPSR